MKENLANILVVLSLTALITGCGKPSFVGTYEGTYYANGIGESEVIMVIERDGSIYREEHYRPIGIANIDVWGTGIGEETETSEIVAEPYYGKWRKISDDEIVATFNDELNIEPLTITLSSDGKMIIVESQVPYYMTYNYKEYLDRTNTKVQKLRERKVIGESTEKPESQTKNIFGKPVEPDGIDEIDTLDEFDEPEVISESEDSFTNDKIDFDDVYGYLFPEKAIEEYYDEICASVFPESEKHRGNTDLNDLLDSVATDTEDWGYGNIELDYIWEALDASGNVIGYIVFTTSREGFAGDIQICTGINKEGKLTGVAVLEINETPGKGMLAKEPEFTDQFVGKDASSDLELVKTGNADKNQIDAISGATYTSRAVTNAVNAAIHFVNTIEKPNTESWDENLHYLEFRILDDNPSKENIQKTIDALEYRVLDTYGYLDLGDDVSRKDIYIGMSELDTIIVHGLPEEVYYQLLEDYKYPKEFLITDSTGTVIIDGKDVIDVWPPRVDNLYIVEAQLTEDGQKKMQDGIKNNVGNRIEIKLDNRRISNPVVTEEFMTYDGWIRVIETGDPREACDLSRDLLMHCLPLRLELID